MGQSKDKEQTNLRAIEARAALKAANTRKTEGPRVLDGFGRRLLLNDGILLTQTSPMTVIWRVTGLTPATEPEYQGAVWIDVMAVTRVLAHANVPNGNIVLGPLAEEAQAAADTDGQPAAPSDSASVEHHPGEARSPGGIILSDPDGLSER